MLPTIVPPAVASRLFVTAKARIYKLVPRQSSGATVAASGSSKKTGASGGGGEGGSAAQYEVRLVLEENAKWGLAADVMKEIRDLHASRARYVHT